MKMRKSIHILFACLNILGIFIEYFLLYILFKDVLNLSQLISFIISLSFLIFIASITIYSNLRSKNIFGKNSKKVENEYQNKIIDSVKKKYYLLTNKDIDIKYIDASIQPSIMFALMGNIYINTNKLYNYKIIKDVHFEGVITHELGHVLHMSWIYMIANIRPSAILGNLLFILTFHYSRILGKKKNKVSSYISFSILYIIFLLCNLLNFFILYPFKKYEELQADRLSLSFSNGYSLRGYYYKLYIENQSKLDLFRFNFIDFNHPSPKNHYLKLKELMGTEFIDCELVSQNKIQVLSDLNSDESNMLRVKFYEKVVDKDILSMYVYIGNRYLDIKDTNQAKAYYLKAGQNNVLAGYRKLIRLLKLENNTENVMEYYKILSKSGDREAKLFMSYYEKTFTLHKLHINGLESDSLDSLCKSQMTLKLFIDNSFTQTIDSEELNGKFIRKNKRLKLFFNPGEEAPKEYYFENGSIISKTYMKYDETNNDTIKVKEFYT